VVSTDSLSEKSTVIVPTGITTVLVGETITQHIDCTVLPNTAIQVFFHVIDAKEHNVTNVVTPSSIFFQNLDTVSIVRLQNITLFGIHDGRFYLEYTLVGKDKDKYLLNAQSSVILVTEENQGWQGIWYQLAFNSIFFFFGLFVWTKNYRFFFFFSHQEKRFERFNYENLNEQHFTKKYKEIIGSNTKKRFANFLSLPCDGTFVCTICGIPAALNLRFHLDAGHLFSFLSIFSICIMLPVNYLSSQSNQKDSSFSFRMISFQQTTLSNVPLESEWYWIHVVYCYLVACGVMFFLSKQIFINALLRKRTKRIIGGRSVLIHHGLCSNMTNKKLYRILNELFQSMSKTNQNCCIEQVCVLYDLKKLHQILKKRRILMENKKRKQKIDILYQTGKLSQNLLWLPGKILVPSFKEMFWNYFYCKPFRYIYQHHDDSSFLCCYCCRSSSSSSSSSTTTTTSSSTRKENYCTVSEQKTVSPPSSPSLSSPQLNDLDDDLEKEKEQYEELDYFPEDALEIYQCNGAAFVIFDSVMYSDTPSNLKMAVPN
jgi:hypothetical protein